MVFDRDAYLRELHNIVGDRDTYVQLSGNPVREYKKTLLPLVEKGFQMGILNEKEKIVLIPKAPRVPILYCLPKIQKSLTCPPGRPIVSGIGSIMSRVGKYIDHFLQPLVHQVPSYVKDTRHVINLLSKIRSNDQTLLVTADVTSLYTIIPHHLGVTAVEYYLSKFSPLPKQTFIIELLEYAAGHNYFWFDHQYYRQQCGVAMGAKYAPSLANLFMAKWEEDVIYKDRSPHLSFWARYIDDILLLWDGSTSQLDDFFSLVNTNDRGIRFVYEMSQEKFNVLDLTISKDGDAFKTILFFKKTDRNAFIPIGSCHHDSWLKSILKNQFIRMRRNCTDVSDYRTQAGIILSRLEEKGYDKDSLVRVMEQVETMDRATLLNEAPREDNKGPTLPFITTFSTHIKLRTFYADPGICWEMTELSKLSYLIKQIVFRGVSSLRDRIAPNVVDPPTQKVSFFFSEPLGLPSVSQVPDLHTE